MRITNLNPDTGIGASAWFLEIEGNRLLMDAGTHPKREGYESLPLFKKIAHEDVDAIAITHCHHDHVGALPLAVRHFPKAHVLVSELSYFLVERVLHNSVNVMVRQREELGIKEYPLYSHDELDEIASRFQGCRYGREMEWTAFHKSRAGLPSPVVEFFDAGHALGSAGLMIRGDKQSLFYTGDACFHDQTLLRAARFDDVEADVLLMETTRGNRAVPAGFSRQSEIDKLAEAIDRVLHRGGSVLLPVFALGRTQEILAMLALEMRAGRLQRQPIFIGGLGKVFTEIYDLQSHRAHRQHPNLRLTEELDLQVLGQEQLRSINLSEGRIFVLTAGMMSENTAAHDLAVRMAGDEKQAIFFVGYADPDTPGGRLKQSVPGQPIFFSKHAPELVRQCEMLDFDLTAHANREDMLDFVGHVSPRVVLLAHGDPGARQWFDEQIRSRYPHMRIVQPSPGETVEI